MATAQNIIDRVKDNLGNRNTGNIGSRSVDEAILDNINTCIMQIAKCKKHIAVWEKSISLTVTSANYKYAVPVVDPLGVTIRIKKIIKMVSVRGSETTGYPLARIHPLRRDSLFPLTNTSRTGRPELYSIYENTMEFWPFPDTTYTITGRVIIWPNALTINSQSTGLGDEFDDVIENGATSSCFKSLQQLEDASSWDKDFKDSLDKTLACLDDYPDEDMFAGGGSSLIGEMRNLYPDMASGRTSSYNSALGIS